MLFLLERLNGARKSTTLATGDPCGVIYAGRLCLMLPSRDTASGNGRQRR
ncbi:MAG: hypothetical protein LBD91_07285 [Prevotellaceae bacterium]|nr:hypothetical protein [Prevotellaceae bacterium]